MKKVYCLIKRDLLSNVRKEKLDRCIHCLAGKQTRVSFKTNSPSRRMQALELVHTDVCGPIKVSSLVGAMYFVTFIDDFFQKIWVYALKRKDQVLGVFKEFHALVERQIGKNLKCIRSDNGGEYVGPLMSTVGLMGSDIRKLHQRLLN